MNKSNITRTAKREYFTGSGQGQWFAWFQPLNPKTNTPWQASRQIHAGWDCYLLSNHRTGNYKLEQGNPPPFEVWSKDYTSCRRGFSSEALALAAIEAAKAAEPKDKSPDKAAKAPDKSADFSIVNGGSICLFRPLTQAAKDWLNEHCSSEEHQYLGSALAVEARYVENLAAAAVNDGLTL